MTILDCEILRDEAEQGVGWALRKPVVFTPKDRFKTDKRIYRQTDRWTCRQTDRWTCRQTDRWTYRQFDKAEQGIDRALRKPVVFIPKTDRLMTDKRTYKQTDRWTYRQLDEAKQDRYGQVCDRLVTFLCYLLFYCSFTAPHV